MKKTDKLGSAKKFGTRYGSTPKYKYAKIEAEKKKKYKCPSCSYEGVKYVSMGIWQCEKCGYKFASKAFSVSKNSTTQTIASNEKVKEDAE